MTRDEAKNKLGCKKLKELAVMLDITGEAISQWDPNCIPKLREYQVNDLYAKLQSQSSTQQTVNQAVAESNI